MAEAAATAARPEVETIVKSARDAGPDDLLDANGYIFCAPENLASVGVAERLALRREGLEVEDRWFPETGWTSTITYAVLDREWDER